MSSNRLDSHRKSSSRSRSLSRSSTGIYASSPIPQTSNDAPSVHSPLLLDPSRSRRAGSYTIRREVLLTICCVLCFVCSGGLILGFGPFYTTLVDSEEWHEHCPPHSTDVCPTQEVFLQVVFSTSFLLLSAANVVFGLCIDIVGPRVAAIVGLLLATVGNLCVAYGESTVYDGIGIIAGYGLIGMGGMGLFLSSFQVINLFENQGIPCSIMSSLFNLSAYVYMLLKVPGTTRITFFGSYAIVSALALGVCFATYPAKNIHHSRPHLLVPGLSLYIPTPRKPTLLLDGLKQALRSGDLWHFAFFFGWLSLVFSFTGGAIPSIIRRTATDMAAADVYTNFLFPTMSNSTFLFAPFIGYCIERFGFQQVFAGCLFLTQLFLATLLVPVVEVQLLGFVFCSIAQASLYTLQFAYIST
ncbi:hypothetical protein, variant [Aphanomyces invadans]|uniref:Major facilitator superfamily (MFS) profile domain-containing protein n=1 Tax=Aphanomyces invadans TaxID=157072 RepID=A0A024U8W6_9STRA|nr:hypothetical protein, variant [Aphanomyces invadans]ETW02317.1 hypothetical protein, variant [Aphanomyces invadans]|eukprot:XP_008868922.1 hypothetical protein, variant [Aphanomyces invadans]